MTRNVEQRAKNYLEKNPSASVAELGGALKISPKMARSLLETPKNPDNAPPEPPGGDAKGGGDGAETPLQSADYYQKLRNLHEKLGEIHGQEMLCPANRDFTDWYNERTRQGAKEARPWCLAKDDLVADRTLYSALNYSTAEWWVDSWRGYEWGSGGRDWEAGQNPLPEYAEIGAFALFADIDLESDVKRLRPDGDAPQDMIESALSAYTAAFARLAGSLSHVFVLDSVGGAYAFVAPTATLPIAEAFGPADRGRIFEDMTDRMNQWLESVNKEVHDAVPGAVGVFEADCVNNKNRLFKAPLSIHGSLDGVVTPVNPENPSYEYTPLADVDGDLIRDAESWAQAFTADHSAAVNAVVSTLWPQCSEATDTWQDALALRLEDLEEARSAIAENQPVELSAEDLPDDISKTDELAVLNAAVEAIDCRHVARDLADDWDTSPGRDQPRFNPPWRSSESGTSCFVNASRYVDLKEDRKGGGPLNLVARATGILRDSGHDLRGRDYWLAVNELRKLGYHVPYFEGKSGVHPDVLQLVEDPKDTDEQRRQALRALRASERR